MTHFLPTHFSRAVMGARSRDSNNERPQKAGAAIYRLENNEAEHTIYAELPQGGCRVRLTLIPRLD